MGSGHNRGGRGNNRRPRNGPPRGGRGPQNQGGANGQRSSHAAMLAVPPRHSGGLVAAGQPGPSAEERDAALIEVDEVEEVEVAGEEPAEAVAEAADADPEAPGATREEDDQGGPPARERPALPRQPQAPYMPAAGRTRPADVTAARERAFPAFSPQGRPVRMAASNGVGPNGANGHAALSGRPSVDEDQDEGAAESQPGAGARPRPERFVVAERPAREHGERYHHVPGTPDVRGEVGELIDSLRELFVRDRAVASQSGTARCGVCYFHHPLADLVYREAEGYYVCPTCERALGTTRLSMVRRQQRLS